MAGKSSQTSVDISSSVLPDTTNLKVKMFGVVTKRYIAMAILAILLCMVNISQANYKNAPMNGIMFGKRGPTEYDSRGKTFTALCEIATEACQAWFPSQENK